MDPLTHGLLGAAAAAAAARRPELRRAALVGMAGALLPDTDVLLFASEADPLREVELHRHFSHALAFVPFGALLVAGAFRLAWRGRSRLSVFRLWLYAALGMLTAGLLDSGTGFGTHLLWPFSDARSAWGIVAVIDPLPTLALLLAVAFALKRRSRRWAAAGIVLLALYLGAGVLQQQRARDALVRHAAAQGHAVERLVVRPTLGNLLLWRGVYESAGRYHAAGVRAGASTPRIYPGGSVPRFRRDMLADGPPADSVAATDIARFARFSDGWLVQHPQQPQVVGDVRFAMLPNSLVPLWGIEVDPERPQAHVRWRNFRTADRATRAAFLAMLRGADLPAP